MGQYEEKKRLALPAPRIWNVCIHTLVYNDAWDLFLSRRAASDAIAFHKSIHLSQVLKGAVHSCGKLRNIVGFQNELERRKDNINEMKCNYVYAEFILFVYNTMFDQSTKVLLTC